MKRRIIYVPDDYRLPCELGWAIGREGRIELDTGGRAHWPGQIWFLDSNDVRTLPPPAP